MHALPRWSAGKVVWHLYLLSSEHYNWQPETRMDLITAAQPTIRGEIQLARIRTKSRVARPTARLATLSLIPRTCVCHSRKPYLSGFFPCLGTASDQWWGKNVQGKNLGGLCKSFRSTMHKSSVPRTPYAWLRSLAGLCGL